MDHLVRSLTVLGQSVRTAADRRLAERGASFAEFHLLEVLRRDGAQSMGTLARQLGVEVSTVTHHVGRLAGAGYVERTPSPTDRRSVTVALTPSGRARSRSLAKVMDAVEDDLRRLLSPAEASRLTSLSARLHDRLRSAP